jgi:hypothetical protein
MFIPQFKILDSTGSIEIITLSHISYTNIPQTKIKHTVIEGIRGIGGLVVLGSTEVFNAVIQGVLTGNDYSAVTSAIDNLESKVTTGTKFKLKLDKTVSTSYIYNVIRVEAINYPESLRNYYQKFEINFLANSW